MAAVISPPMSGFGSSRRITVPTRMLLAGVVAIAAAVAAGVGAVPATADPTPRVADGGSAVVDPGIPASAGMVDVIVQGRSGVAWTTIKDSVSNAGGQVVAPLPIVDGASVRIAGDQVAELARQAGITAITLDRKASFEELTYDEAGTASAFVGASRADAAWQAGHLGEGIGVAVLDTGVSEMPDFEGRLVHGPDLSGEGKLIDTYGHGTVMAGIIAGSGADSATNPGGAYTGVAPKAHVVAVKVAGANGAADVTSLLQGMHWVSAYQQQFNIRVLNLSWGTASTQDPAVDPLNYAVQRLWNQGITVVVAAGNSGPRAGTITKPADDPLVITVGGFNDQGTASLSDDEGVNWSSVGPTATGLAKPDIVASGRRLIAQRSYGSTVETENPKALVAPSYIRGSGSSQAAAVTSGAAAVLLSARPDLTPDQVKHLLTRTADPIPKASSASQGAGRIDIAESLTADAGAPRWQQSTATGLGSIEASRGGRWVQTDCGNDGTIEVIEGEIDARCEEWDGSSWSGSSWSGSSWSGSSWSGSSWSGSSWSGSSWSGSSWSGSSWSGGDWTGSSWSGDAWTGSSWSGSSWSGSSWSGSSWSGSSWSGSSWSGSSWSNDSWTTGMRKGEDGLFLTSFWGMNPPAGKYVPGERYTAGPSNGVPR